MRRMNALVLATAVLLALGGCQATDEPSSEAAAAPEAAATLGPVDGRDLPGTDLDRVAVGAAAPDFVAAALSGPPIRLSDFRGSRFVVLMFYRGHW